MGEIAPGSTDDLDRHFSRYWGPLTSYVSRMLGERELAEDIVQTTFVRFWLERGKAPPKAVRPYLFRMARNLALDEMRSRKSRTERETRLAQEGGRSERAPDEILDAATLSRVVAGAIQQLPPRRREAFTLAYLRDMTYAEVAAVMGVSQKTVGHHISAALTELRKRLGPLNHKRDERSTRHSKSTIRSDRDL